MSDVPRDRGSDRSSLERLLRRLESELASYGAPIAGALLPGLSDTAVAEALATEGLRAPADVQAWFGWHDGAHGGKAVESGPGLDFVAENALAAGWHLLTIADALRIRRWNLNDYASIGADVLPASWLPVLHANEQGALCADCALDVPPLYIVDGAAGLPEPQPRPQFDSLVDFVGTVLRLFDEGLVRPDPELPGVVGVDFGELDADLRRLKTW